MRLFRSFILLGCLTSFLSSLSFGQATSAAIADPAKELKRTSHQLRISVDHLKNARDALKQATELARHSSDGSAFSQIASDWTRIDKAHAPGALADLYGWLRAAARDAPDLQTYSRCMMSAQSLMRSLVSLDSDLAVSLWEQWPDPPAALGESAARMHDQAAQFAKQLAGSGSGRGSGPLGLTGAPGLTEDAAAQQVARGNYSSAGSLASQLLQSGEKDKALRVADQAIADFRQRDADQRALSSYSNFVRQLSNVDAGRYLLALSSLLPALGMQNNPATGGIITVGDQTIQVSAAEAYVIDSARNLFGRPDLAMKTLNTLPGLKDKLERIGGIDSITEGNRGMSRTNVSIDYSIDGVTRSWYKATADGSSSSSTGNPISNVGAVGSPLPTPGAAAQDLYLSLRGQLAKNPGYVRQKLADVAKTPDQVNELISLAGRASMQEPDLASMALDLALPLVMQVEPLVKRAAVFQSLMSAYQSLDGEVDADLLQKGLALVQQLREEEKNAQSTNPAPSAFRNAAGTISSSMLMVAPRGSTADQLELAIVSELALANFDGAMKYLRLMPDEQRLQALLRIVQNLMMAY